MRGARNSGPDVPVSSFDGSALGAAPGDPIVRLFGSLRPDLLRFAHWLARDRAIAEDIVQEALLRAWRSREALKDQTAARAWLLTIVRREHARLYERKRLELVALDDAVEAEGIPSRPGPDSDLDSLRGAILKLPLEYREPLIMQVLGGFTTAEIAQELSLSSTAVLTRLFRARNKLRAMYGLTPAPYAMGEPDRPAYIIYTSGTSGHPRAVVHAHRTVWARRMMWEGWYGLLEQDRVLHAGAFNWTYTLGAGLLDPWARGATALIPGHGVASEVLGLLLKQHDATIFAAAPGLYGRLLRTELPRLERLRHGLSAGEKLPEATRSAWEKATGTPIHEAFGMSECSTFISGSPSGPVPRGTLGHPQRGAAGWRCSASMDRSASGSLAVSASRSAILG